jgi:nitrite reductase/ring-hydroxylating ferredoxin subunit
VTFQRAARSDEVVHSRFHLVEIHGRSLLLSRLKDGTAIAFGRICPHRQLEMDEGSLWDELIDCPHHHHTYDPRTGENVFPRRVFPAARARLERGIPVFEVLEEDGWVFVGAEKQVSRDEAARG